jgi:hypothetical protein
MVTGANPFMVRRTHYFEDLQFIDCFSPHPDHKFLAPVSYMVQGIRPLIEQLEAVGRKRLTIAKWFIRTGEVGQLEPFSPAPAAAIIKHVPPDNRTVSIYIPYSGKVTQTAAVPENLLPSGDYAIPEWPLFTIKNYRAAQSCIHIDPFFQLREALKACAVSRQEHAAAREKQVAHERTDAAIESEKTRPWNHTDLVFFSSLLLPTMKSMLLGLGFIIPVIELDAFKDVGHLINPFERAWLIFPLLLAFTVAGNVFDAWSIRSASTKKRRLLLDVIERMFTDKHHEPIFLSDVRQLYFDGIVLVLLGAFLGLALRLTRDIVRLFW